MKWYRIYRLRKTRARIYSDFKKYVAPLCNVKRVMQIAADEQSKVDAITEELKELGVK